MSGSTTTTLFAFIKKVDPEYHTPARRRTPEYEFTRKTFYTRDTSDRGIYRVTESEFSEEEFDNQEFHNSARMNQIQNGF